ncbi:hypothetical protein AB1Y20_006614 [Prymnesium parvum]|uniref:tRNA/rRNA methyltransferase SpoU type domain-containing protein n=1 Tax=Prymnesium parvum TaxID=97485 RepID=A0AB34IYW9_PRYPA
MLMPTLPLLLLLCEARAFSPGTPEASLPKSARPLAPTKAEAVRLARLRPLHPAVLLVRTFDAPNVGAAARAMLNFGLCDLRLAAPECDWTCEAAVLRASGAAPLLHAARRFDGVAEATRDAGLVLATTARPRDLRLPVLSPRAAAARAAEAAARGERVCFMFGSEKNGLSNEELRVAHALVAIPTDPNFSSLNLAQAVLLTAYEWALARPEAIDAPVEPEAKLAVGSQLQSLLGVTEAALWRTGFFGGGRRVEEADAAAAARARAAMDKLRCVLMRSQPSESEVGLLQGALRSLLHPKNAVAAEPRGP